LTTRVFSGAGVGDKADLGRLGVDEGGEFGLDVQGLFLEWFGNRFGAGAAVGVVAQRFEASFWNGVSVCGIQVRDSVGDSEVTLRRKRARCGGRIR
jgi:hypothetical protein